jgi:hypothetical protein
MNLKIHISILFSLVFFIDCKAQLIGKNDSTTTLFYHEATNYSQIELDSFLALKSNAKDFQIQKKDSFSLLAFKHKNSFLVRFKNYAIFETKDSTSEINYIVFQLIKSNPNLKSISISCKDLKQDALSNYSYSALNCAYLKKYNLIYVPLVKTFSISERQKDYPNEKDEANYIDIYFELNTK